MTILPFFKKLEFFRVLQNFSPKIFGLSLGIFGTIFGQSRLNFGTFFGQFRLKFQDCIRIVQTQFSEMFLGVLDSMESPLSLESSHMPVNGIWGPYIF